MNHELCFCPWAFATGNSASASSNAPDIVCIISASEPLHCRREYNRKVKEVVEESWKDDGEDP